MMKLVQNENLNSKLSSQKNVFPKNINNPLNDQKQNHSSDKGLKNDPDYKLDLSLPSLPKPLVPPPLTPPSSPSSPSSNPSSNEIKSNTENKLTENAIKDGIKSESKRVEKDKIKEKSIKKDLVLFIKGLDIFSSPSKSEGGYAGVERMAESVKDAKVYKWNDQENILDEIKKIHPDNKIILVGHSLGGDTAVEIANTLDSLPYDFRTVDLLITMDSIGMNNDIIPQNVKKHLNVFGENSFILNDGPHVARRNEKTEVQNILTPVDHTEIDDNKEIQFEIMNLIQKSIK